MSIQNNLKPGYKVYNVEYMNQLVIGQGNSASDPIVANASLQIKSTLPMIMPKNTASNIYLTSSPATGMMAYNTSSDNLLIYTGTGWTAH